MSVRFFSPLETPTWFVPLTPTMVSGFTYVAVAAASGADWMGFTAAGISGVFSLILIVSMHYRVRSQEEENDRLDKLIELRSQPEPEPVNDEMITVPNGVYNRTANVLTLLKPASRKRKHWTDGRKKMEIVTRAYVSENAEGTNVRVYDVNNLLWRWAHAGGAEAVDTSERRWTPGTFEYDEFRALRLWMIKQGLGYWKSSRSHKHGWELHSSARRMMRRFSQMDTPPPMIEVTFELSDL